MLEALGERALLEVRLETGRTHQIRVHLEAIELPVCGDPVYGVAGDLGLERQFLHAHRLRVRAPVHRREPIDVSSPLPADLEAALDERGRSGVRPCEAATDSTGLRPANPATPPDGGAGAFSPVPSAPAGAPQPTERTIVAVVSMKELLEAGVHFGHQTRRWNPKMKRFIFDERGGIYIIDLQQTQALLQEAHDFARNVAERGGSILFVGTKKQAQEAIEREATRVGSRTSPTAGSAACSPTGARSPTGSRTSRSCAA